MNARKNHHLFPRWLFSSVVSVAECSSSSFASALNDEESSSRHLEPSSSKNNVDTKTKKNLPAKADELNAIHAKQALRELSLRQISQNYQPTHEENKTVRDWKTDIRMYKKHLSDKADREARERKAKVRT